jgi:hypothetical protein
MSDSYANPLKHLLGLSNVKNYDGSWAEWGNAVGAPIETGATEVAAQPNVKAFEGSDMTNEAFKRYWEARPFESFVIDLAEGRSLTN